MAQLDKPALSFVRADAFVDCLPSYVQYYPIVTMFYNLHKYLLYELPLFLGSVYFKNKSLTTGASVMLCYQNIEPTAHYALEDILLCFDLIRLYPYQ